VCPATNKQITIADLAKALGLDKSSVSLALRGSRKIGAATRDRVLKTAREMRYRPNLAARQLSSGAPQVVALVLPSAFVTLANDVAVAAVQALAKQASEVGLVFAVASCDDLLRQQKDASATTLQPDGLFVWGDVPATATAQLAAMGRPLVVLDPNHPSYVSYTCESVRVDNEGGAGAVIEHLLERGAQRVLFVHAVRDHLGHAQRWDGARRAWAAKRSAAGLTRVFADELDDESLARFAGRKHAAIFCSNDFAALQIWHRLQETGIGVPQDVLLAGFDGDRAGSLIDLTTVVFDGAGIARIAFAALAASLAGKETKLGAARVPVSLRIGVTTGTGI